MNSIKMSIIIPVYNSESTLKRCIESIIKQQFNDIEIIFINDCSTDSSLKILEYYKNKDDRFVIINNKKNEGPGICRNKGIEVAKGEYLAFIDADDCFEDKMLFKCYNKAKDIDADVLVFNYMTFDSSTKIINKEFSVPYIVKRKIEYFVTPDMVSEYIFNIFDVCAWNKIYKREFIRENNITFLDLKYGEDLYFSLLSLALSKKIAYLDEYLYYYTINQENSASSVYKIRNNYLSPYKAIKMVKYALENRNIFEKYERSLNLLLFESVNYHLPILADISKDLVEVIKKEKEFKYEEYITTLVEKNHINLLMKNKEKICKFFDNIKANNSIALWGVALRGQAFMEVIDKNNIKIDYLIDKDTSKHGKILSGIKVNSYNDIKDKVNVIIVMNSYFCEAILNETNGKNKVFDMNAYLNFGIDFEECFN